MKTDLEITDATVESIANLAVAGQELQETRILDVYIRPDGEGFLDARVEQKPNRVVQASPAFARTDSFNEYVARFKDDRTQIFAELGQAKVTARLDYYTPSAPVNEDWNAHAPVLVMKRTPAWEKWKAFHDKALKQEAFAELLEDLTLTISEPNAATIAELVRKFESVRNVTFKSEISRTNGDMVFQYTDQESTVHKMKVPETFEVDIRPFEASDPVQIVGRIRYKVDDGKLTFRYVFDRYEDVEREAFETVLTQVETATGLKPLVQP